MLLSWLRSVLYTADDSSDVKFVVLTKDPGDSLTSEVVADKPSVSPIVGNSVSTKDSVTGLVSSTPMSASSQVY